MRAALMLLIGSLAYSAQSFCLTTSAPAGVSTNVPTAVLASVSPFSVQAHLATQAVQLARSRSSSRSSSSHRSSRPSVVHTSSRTSSKNTRSSNCAAQPSEATRLTGADAAGNKLPSNTKDRNGCADPYGIDQQGNTAGGF